jgi:hypothetical protein
MITEYVKVVPKAISITTEPSYIGSFLEVVTKAYNKQLKLLANTPMKNKKAKTEPVQTTDAVEVPAEVEVEKARTKAVDAAEDVKPGEKEAGQPELSLNDETTDAESVGKDTNANPLAQIAAIEAQLAVLKEQFQMEEETESEPEVQGEMEPETPGETEPEQAMPEVQEAAAEVEPEVPGEKEPETPGETEPETTDVPEGTEVKADPAAEPAPADAPVGVEAKIDALAQGLKMVVEKLDALVQSDKDVHAQIGKAKQATDLLMKATASFYDEVASLPLQKRSLVKARSSEEILDDRPKTVKEAAVKLFNL